MDGGTLNQWWLALTLPALIGGILLIGLGIALLLRTVRGRELTRLPLSAEQEFDLLEAGPLSFLIDKPRFRNVQAAPFKPFALSIGLEDKAGRLIQAARALAPLSIEGVGRTRTEIANLAGAAAGRYTVRVIGLVADVAHTGSFLVIARPIPKLTLVVSILVIVASAALALGGLIASVATFVPFQSG